MSDSNAITYIEPSRGWHSLQLAPIWHHRELLYFLCWRNVKVRYKQAAIGIGWVLLQPVLTMAVFWVIFGVLAKVGSDGVPYPVFAFTALVPWNFFSQAVSRCGTSLVGDAPLITKVYFPRVLIPLSACTTPLVDFLLSFVLLLGLMTWYGIPLTATALALPLFMALGWLTALAVGLWLGPLNVKYRDIGHALPFVTQIWMYASPVLYSSTLIHSSDKVPAWVVAVYGLNPMVGVIEGFRWALLGTAPPDWNAIGLSMIVVSVLLVTGSAYFRKMERTFADIV